MSQSHTPLRALALGIAFATCAAPLWAQNSNADPPQRAAQGTTAQDADNTRVNQRDRNDTTKPTDQPNDKADIQTAAAVRKAIENDKSLSTSAHNVKLIASNGVVTLRGPVSSAQEKAKIEQIVANVSGVSRVDNNLDIKTDTKKE